MKYGVKLWSTNNNLYKDVISLINQEFDYLELLYVPFQEKDVQLLIDAKVPMIIHTPTLTQGICFSYNDIGKNYRFFEMTQEFANKLNAEYIIMHPDFGKKKNFTNFLRKIDDQRVLIENMPKYGTENELAIGYSISEIKEFLEIGNFGFCLDFEKAIKSALAQNISYKGFIKELMKLNPNMFHISDGKTNNFRDEHLNLGEGNFDLKFLKNCIDKSENKLVTIETPKKNGLNQDILNLKYFKKI